MDAHLMGLSGPFSGQTVPIHRNLLIGREPDCDLQLESAFVSAHQCVLLLDEYTLRIRDLGSKNGTFVNGRRISTTAILLHNDTVSIGEVSFLIHLTQATVGTGPADPWAKPEVSPTTLEDTVFCEGDTVHTHTTDSPAVIPPPHIESPASTPVRSVNPLDLVRPVSPVTPANPVNPSALRPSAGNGL